MEYKALRDLKLSRLGFGNMRLPEEGGRIDRVKAKEMIDLAMAGGVNYYDTAWVYHGGDSETFLGEALKDYARDSFYVATKFNISADPDYRKVFARQLEKLKTDYIDFYLIHCIMDNNIHPYVDDGAVDYFLEQQRKGRVRYLGFSCHSSVESLRWFADHHQWDFAQLQLNYYDWLYSATPEEYHILEERNIPIMVMEPVRGGKLAKLTPEAEAILREAHPEWSIPSWGFRFVRNLPMVQTILSGMSTLEQVEDNLKTFADDSLFTETDRNQLFRACEIFHKQIRIPCTACRYCCDDCPMQINIPEFLRVYNQYKVDGDWGIKEKFAAVSSEGTPADCVACGACMDHCPQNIQIPDLMGEMSEKFFGE